MVINKRYYSHWGYWYAYHYSPISFIHNSFIKFVNFNYTCIYYYPKFFDTKFASKQIQKYFICA